MLWGPDAVRQCRKAQGAFSCIRSDGTTGVSVLDPPAQPWVTSVGGTSFETFNPNANPNPVYPNGVESVWNFLNLCNAGGGSDGLTGFDWCAGGGAGGGGNSIYWGRPRYQVGQSVNNNGFFPTTPGFDRATGIGTPKMSAIITGLPDL